jgi:hypothetical protein
VVVALLIVRSDGEISRRQRVALIPLGLEVLLRVSMSEEVLRVC